MATALLKNAILSNPTLRKTLGVYCNPTRSHWNFQYKPGPYPRTPEERCKAAQRYGMTVEEYRPYPEEMCYGDYPKLPDIGTESKDPNYPWDMPEFRRNFKEPVHALAEIYGEDRVDISMKPRFSGLHQFMWFFGVVGGAFALYFFLEDYKFGRPVTAKQYPHEGPHYYF